VKTYANVDERNGRQFAFEVENSYIGLGSIAQILSDVDGVTAVSVRPLFASSWGENRVRFKFQGRDFVVWEPHGDSSRYWIGPQREEDRIDIGDIEQAFQLFQPSPIAKLAGDILTLKVLRRIFGRA